MNKLDFMAMGKKAVLSYIYDNYGFLLDTRDFGMISYSSDSHGQRGKYRIEPWAHDTTLVSNIYQVDYIPEKERFKVSEWKIQDDKYYTAFYILATTETVHQKIQQKH